jgi:hypothetical protein
MSQLDIYNIYTSYTRLKIVLDSQLLTQNQDWNTLQNLRTSDLLLRYFAYSLPSLPTNINLSTINICTLEIPCGTNI